MKVVLYIVHREIEMDPTNALISLHPMSVKACNFYHRISLTVCLPASMHYSTMLGSTTSNNNYVVDVKIIGHRLLECQSFALGIENLWLP